MVRVCAGCKLNEANGGKLQCFAENAHFRHSRELFGDTFL